VNYRHAFHAGNFADVHKHVVLLALLERLRRKPKPIFHLDTHAGRGSYDLQSADASRGREWRDGVARIAQSAPQCEDLLRYRSALTAHGWPRRYPGSPLLAVHDARAGDRCVFVEQQIVEAQALENALHGRRGVSVVCGDGYAALRTYLPPRENRGLVLIDPPYESQREFEQVVQALRFGLGRWPNGVYALWHPIKSGGEVARLHAALRRSELRKLLLLELSVRPEDSPLGLNGSGMLVVNPPWRFDEEMRMTMQELHRLLDPAGAGATRVEWLARDDG